MNKDFLANLYFAEYVRLLFQLRGLIATKAGDSPEAEVVRAEMDSVWSRFGAPERDELRRLSEQLSAIHEQECAGAVGEASGQ